jgi:hypothetical protein
LGYLQKNIPTATRLRLIRSDYVLDFGRNAVGVDFYFRLAPKVGAGAPTLGFEPESRWDSWMTRLLLQENEMRPKSSTSINLLDNFLRPTQPRIRETGWATKTAANLNVICCSRI